MIRLSAADLASLTMEAVDAPMHIGVVMLLDGRTLRDAHDDLRMADIRGAVERRLRLVPELRRRLHYPGPLAGRPLWIDDAGFHVARHVRRVRAPFAADEAALLRLADALLASPLDRAHPLWRLWFVDGLPGGRIALVVAAHHAIADGAAMLKLVGALLDGDRLPSGLTGTPPEQPAAPPPRWFTLFLDNIRSRAAAMTTVMRGRPSRSGVTLRRLRRLLTSYRSAPRTSLNRAVHAGRRTAVVRFDLDMVKQVAHGYGATVNDVVMTIAAGGLRHLLRTRGEPIDNVTLHAAVAVAGQNDERSGNHSGGIVVRLPLAPGDPRTRLAAIRDDSRRAKSETVPAIPAAFADWLARTRVTRSFTRHQHFTNVVVSNLVGPRVPMRVFGAPVLEVLPSGVLAGNLGLSFLAFSYCGQLTITVHADAETFPDLAVLVEAMADDWHRLAEPAMVFAN